MHSLGNKCSNKFLKCLTLSRIFIVKISDSQALWVTNVEKCLAHLLSVAICIWSFKIDDTNILVLRSEYWLSRWREKCCTSHYLSWTDSINSSLQFLHYQSCFDRSLWINTLDNFFKAYLNRGIFESLTHGGKSVRV